MTNLYMTNTTYPLNVAEIWVVDFLTLGFPVQPFVKVGANVFLRCVSGNPSPVFSFLDNGYRSKLETTLVQMCIRKIKCKLYSGGFIFRK